MIGKLIIVGPIYDWKSLSFWSIPPVPFTPEKIADMIQMMAEKYSEAHSMPKLFMDNLKRGYYFQVALDLVGTPECERDALLC